jgi:hypothetical protein
MSELAQEHEPNVVHVSLMTCPRCKHEQAERMPEYACAIAYQCTACGVMLRPLPGDCCVFCSYGSAPCPAIQIARRAESGASRCDLSVGAWQTNHLVRRPRQALRALP